MVNETCDHLDFYLWRVFNNFVVEEQTYGHPHVPPTQFLDEGEKNVFIFIECFYISGISKFNTHHLHLHQVSLASKSVSPHRDFFGHLLEFYNF